MSAFDSAARPYAAADYTISGLYLDSASRHPLPAAAAARLKGYAAFLADPGASQGLHAKQQDIRRLFAGLVHADPEEVAMLPGTTFGERLVLRALGLPDACRAIVTDALHYSTSVAFYRAAAQAGARITILPCAAGGGIDYDRLDQALAGGAALVALSSVSHNNGFVHDLGQVCAMAHARGALVYADIIQHAGALPLDVRESGLDFASCGTYKWLLGDMGLAFFYARRDRWPLLERSLEAEWGGADAPGDDPAARLSPLTLGAGATEVLLETLPRTQAACSGVPDGDRQALLVALDRAFAATGLAPLTPPGSPAPIRAYAGGAVTQAAIARMQAAGLTVTAWPGYLRLSPSRFNTIDQVEQAAAIVAEALARRA